MEISLKNRNFAGQQLLQGGESAHPADVQHSRASIAQRSHAQCPARSGPRRGSTCHRPGGHPPQRGDLAGGYDHPRGSSEGSAAGAPSPPPAQRSAGHDQARTANAFCPSLTFPLPAGLGWDDQARRPLILLSDLSAAPSGSSGNQPCCKAPGQRATKWPVTCCTAAAKPSSAAVPLSPISTSFPKTDSLCACKALGTMPRHVQAAGDTRAPLTPAALADGAQPPTATHPAAFGAGGPEPFWLIWLICRISPRGCI